MWYKLDSKEMNKIERVFKKLILNKFSNQFWKKNKRKFTKKISNKKTLSKEISKINPKQRMSKIFE